MSPDLIENHKFINLGNIEEVDVAQAATSVEFLPGTVQGEEVGEESAVLEDPLLEVSGENQECEQTVPVSEVQPLGWIECDGGTLIPFGIQSIAEEVPGFGDKQLWREIRVCLPPSFFVGNDLHWYCTVASCREKLPKNKSIDVHIKKHLGLGPETLQTSNNSNQATLPCPLEYYCQEKKCLYNVKLARKSFKRYKSAKQHHIKVHAPRPFECDMCQKTFPTVYFAETHKLMCGEEYFCSTCDAYYNSLQTLQTHCRRKGHTYDHVKYYYKTNCVKKEKQMQYSKTGAAPPTTTVSAGGSKLQSGQTLPLTLPKVKNSEKGFNNIQALCPQTGVKVDYGCQTVSCAFLQNSDPVEAVVTKKRKSTDTQTNIVKFRAACLDQRHNATNTNQVWKTVVTSDSENEPLVLTCAKTAKITDAAHLNGKFASIRITKKAKISKTFKLVPVRIEIEYRLSRGR